MHLNKPVVTFLVLILFIVKISTAFGQVPNITYKTPQTYPVNKIITPLTPTTTGGAIPSTIYGQVSTFAGSGQQGSAGGLGTSASFNAPTGVATDKAGNIYVTDNSGGLIRKISPAGMVSTFAGSGTGG